MPPQPEATALMKKIRLVRYRVLGTRYAARPTVLGCVPDDARGKYVVRNAQGSGPERGSQNSRNHVVRVE
jgi:hypothetical protein